MVGFDGEIMTKQEIITTDDRNGDICEDVGISGNQQQHHHHYHHNPHHHSFSDMGESAADPTMGLFIQESPQEGKLI